MEKQQTESQDDLRIQRMTDREFISYLREEIGSLLTPEERNEAEAFS